MGETIIRPQRVLCEGGECSELYHAWEAASYSLLKVIFDFKAVKRQLQQQETLNAQVSLGRVVDEIISGLFDKSKYLEVDGFPTQKRLAVLYDIAALDEITEEAVAQVCDKHSFYPNTSAGSRYKRVMDSKGQQIVKALKEGKVIAEKGTLDKAMVIAQRLMSSDLSLDRYGEGVLLAQLPLSYQTYVSDGNTGDDVTIKGLVDLVHVIPQSRAVRLIDIKVTTDFWQYYRRHLLPLQAAIYSMLMRHALDSGQLTALGMDSSYEITSFDLLVYEYDDDPLDGLVYLYYFDLEGMNDLIKPEKVLTGDYESYGQHAGHKLLEYLYGVVGWDVHNDSRTYVIPSLYERLLRYVQLRRLGFRDDPARHKPIKL